MADSRPVYDTACMRSNAIEELIGLWCYRDLVLELEKRNIVTRYKRSLLGVSWTLLNPLGMMLVLTLAFSHLFGSVRTYPAYVLSGLIAWDYFTQVTESAMHQIVWGGALMRKVYVPKTVFVLATMGAALVNVGIATIPLIGILLITGIGVGASVLFLPVALLLLSFFSLGVSMVFSVCAVYFPDFVEVQRILLSAWFYLTPVIYPQDIVPEVHRSVFLQLNPMTHLISLVRLPLYEGILPDHSILIPAITSSVLAAVLGWLLFTSKSPEFWYRT